MDAGLRAHVQRVWLHPADPAGPVKVSFGTSAPTGHVVAEQYAILPRTSRPRVLVPLGVRRGTVPALGAYSAARSRTSRLARRAMAQAVRTGVHELSSRPRLIVSVDSRLARHRWNEVLLTEHLRQLLDVPGLLLIMQVRPVNPNAKPTVQVFNDAGVPLAYTKIGTTPVTKMLVRREAAVTSALKGQLSGVLVPELLGAGEWNETSYTVGRALPTDLRRWTGKPEDTAPALKEIGATGEVATSSFAHSAYAAELMADIEAGGESADVAGVLRAWWERLAHRPEPVVFGRMHGDWIPDNMGQSGNGLAVWDWEHSLDSAPLGHDLLHWHFKLGMDAGGLTAAVAAVDGAAPALSMVGVPRQSQQLVASLYLLHAFVRRLRLAVGGGGWNARWYPGLISVAHSRDLTPPR